MSLGFSQSVLMTRRVVSTGATTLSVSLYIIKILTTVYAVADYTVLLHLSALSDYTNIMCSSYLYYLYLSGLLPHYNSSHNGVCFTL